MRFLLEVALASWQEGTFGVTLTERNSLYPPTPGRLMVAEALFLGSAIGGEMIPPNRLR